MNSQRSWSPFRGRKSRLQDGTGRAGRRPGTDRVARAAAIERLISSTRYLTDGVELYRLLGAMAGGARDLLGMENCRSLELVLAPMSEIEGGRLWAVAPNAALALP